MPIFRYGDMRLYLLKLLADSPRYGYELIRLLEEKFLGAYVPSAGAVYPRLSALEEEGLVRHETEEGRKVYRLTEKGERELDERQHEIEDLEARMTDWAGGLAESVIEGVRPLIEKIGIRLEDVGNTDEFVRNLRGGSEEAVRHIRAARAQARTRARQSHDAARQLRREARREWRDSQPAGPSLRGDLRAFVDEIAGTAREFPPDKTTRREIQRILLETRHRIADLLEQNAPARPNDPPAGADTDVEVEIQVDGEDSRPTDQG